MFVFELAICESSRATEDQPSYDCVSGSPEFQYEQDKQDVRGRHDAKLKVLGSKFRKPRTSDLELSSVSPVSLFSRVSREYRDTFHE